VFCDYFPAYLEQLNISFVAEKNECVGTSVASTAQTLKFLNTFKN